MIQKFLVKILLLPLSAIYGLSILFRNALYSTGVLRSVSFNLPVIGVGNLSIGGSGKTPHVEYLIRLLQPYLNIGTLSRGYKRKSRGFRMIGKKDSALSAGDEPFQYFLKFKSLSVAVSESRSVGIPMMLSQNPNLNIILLDDSYQHRSVKPGLNILLTEFSNPYYEDIILPAGRLREWKAAADRADIVVVTKCPDMLKTETVEHMVSNLRLKSSQQLFYSKYSYEQPYNLMSGHRRSLESFSDALLLCAIASEEYLLDYLETQIPKITTMIYEDHHFFTDRDLNILNQQFQNLSSENKGIITTEKDATRLLLHKEFIAKENLPIYVLPIHVEFLFDQGGKFDEAIKTFLLNFKV